MNDLLAHRTKVAAARRRRDEAGEALQRARNRAASLRTSLDRVRRRADAHEVAALENELARVDAATERAAGDAEAADRALRDTLVAFPLHDRPQQLVAQVSDRTPILLLPVRVETRFMTVDDRRELWVRIFPDDIAIHSHEERLTADEVEAGRAYWHEIWHARQQTDDEDRRAGEAGAWRALAGDHGSPRAAWIRTRTEPETLDVAEAGDLAFPEFPPEDLNLQSWSRAPRSNVMPDRFVVMLYADGAKVAEVVGAAIPDPLIIGPDPLAAQDQLAQRDGDLVAGPDIDWLFDFERAVALGMAVRIPLAEPHATNGVDRLVVLGLRLSADDAENRVLLEALLENHRFAPDGLALLPQGTPTNNTDAQGAGFSSIDPRADRGFGIEAGPPLFEPVDDRFARVDAQRLADGLGIAYAPLQHIDHADRADVREARQINTALWPATLGYFFEELIGLEPATVERVRDFCIDHVTGRGPLPALRVGAQPYGVLPATAFERWAPERVEGASAPGFLRGVHGVLTRLRAQWSARLGRVARIGGDGDPFANLLETLGLHATSVQFHRRHGVGRDYRWNYQRFAFGDATANAVFEYFDSEATRLLSELGVDFTTRPKILDLAFLNAQDEVTDPLVDDVAAAEDERWSEAEPLRATYAVAGVETPLNYIGWLLESSIDDVKRQTFVNVTGEVQPVPRALLYRLLRRALLLAYHDATLRLYEVHGVVGESARREVELPNIRSERTVTRWEFMEAKIADVLPDVSTADVAVAEFLRTPDGESRTEAERLRQVKDALAALRDLPTARLERLFAEHVDLCSYRLDAWETGLLSARLDTLRAPAGEPGEETRSTGVQLGAFGWLEEVRPAPAAVPVPVEDVPQSLLEPEKGPIVEQPENAGFIPAPSIQHAVTAAVLCNAYLTHADPSNPDRMSVQLSSARVRTALELIEGVRNGQTLGALLGYRFERGLHDGHGDLALDQFIPAFRERYPLVADLITPDESGEPVATKAARNVFDGYALLEQAVLRDPPLPYPYGVANLPADVPGDARVAAIRAEVDAMAAAFDAVADVALAEGVYQLVQGNVDRGSAMLRSLTEGTSPPEPEVVHTPRSGAAITHRVTLHLDSAADPLAWPGAATPRAQLEPGVNAWLADMIGPPDRIRYVVRSTTPETRDATGTVRDLNLQAIDLVYIMGDALPAGSDVSRHDDAAELERRIIDAHRQRKREVGEPDIGDVSVSYDERDASWAPEDLTLFELQPLVARLRQLLTACRPLGADDLRLPSEASADEQPNPKGFELADTEARVSAALAVLDGAIETLADALVAAQEDTVGATELENLAAALRSISAFGMPDAFPREAAVAPTTTAQAVTVLPQARAKLDRAEALITLRDVPPDRIGTLTPEARAEILREAAREILGGAFSLVPRFEAKNASELAAAATFRDDPDGLGRSSDDPHFIEEWLQGVARVRARVAALEEANTLGAAFDASPPPLAPLQLPFRPEDHWVAVQYPPDFRPDGDFLSVVQELAAGPFDAAGPQSGLVVDEWTEVVPGRTETGGIAVHFDQPDSEPPQVLLLAIAPALTGQWSWDDLEAVVLETFDRMQRRGVEPEHLGDTPFAQILPAILTSVTSHRFATISTDLVHRSEVAFPTPSG